MDNGVDVRALDVAPTAPHMGGEAGAGRAGNLVGGSSWRDR
ncbi:hypothetical protein [Aureimonas phyllosphaerae]|uniref:Uncharacterized protein n=1 Tax=Aureimonas phyllosphaerae TaxID=1166078 RepID=A0A7W6BVX8_9HYPH|nr:hypothetical protein [Aureimonas phyllosphaerae]MBB3937059.1 hypothetical protein [Aureimonas phyllosphaerae]MBB3960826.1 hypothetical protein [Aureimonas phyllosphaerae]SFF49908.1 hypothetical protein SAMN05216566_11830 [Aureimonas phyllosphaerae]